MPSLKTWALLSVALTLAGCATSQEEDTDGEGSAIASEERDAVAAKIEKRVGLHPHKFDGLFDNSNEAETLFTQVLPQVKTFIAERIAANKAGITITESEIAQNCIAEGGFMVLDRNRIERLDGFNSFGIDTFMDNLEALRPWLHPSLAELAADPAHVKKGVNEKGSSIISLANFDLAAGVYANAAMYAWYKAQAARAIARAGGDINALPLQGQAFWATMFYNAGAGASSNLLTKHGVGWHTSRWTLKDDGVRYGANIQYNALWRSATVELMAATLYNGNDTRTVVPTPPFEPAGAVHTYESVQVDATTATAAITARGELNLVTFDVDVSAAGMLIIESRALGSVGQMKMPVNAGKNTVPLTFANTGAGAVSSWTIKAPEGATLASMKLTITF